MGEQQEWEIQPYVGVGPIRLGMTRDDVRRVIGVNYETFKRTKDAEMPSDSFDSVGIFAYYRPPGVCEALEFALPSSPTLNGNPLVGRPFQTVLDEIQALDPDVDIEESGITSYKLGIGIYAPFAEEEPDEPVESAIVFVRGYYD